MTSMTKAEKAVREAARRLLKENKIDIIIGHERGTLPLLTTPCFISDPKEVNRLVWDATCQNNLAKYITKIEGKIGVVAKACDARSIVALIVEKQIDRGDINIIGIPCSGVIDRKKIEAKLHGKELLKASIKDDHITLKGEDFERNLPVKELMDDSCQSCKHRNPPVYDVLVGDEPPKNKNDHEFTSASMIEAKPREERWIYFKRELSKCIRCYACRSVCPLCYCEDCFVDQNMPTWLGKTDSISDIIVYHIVRVLHSAGRCVDCGACSRACPMGIDLRGLTQKMVKLVRELYGFEAGLSLEDAPPLTTFKIDDPQEFIK